MNLPEYIERHGGDDECARRWGVKSRTVASWRRRERIPRPAQAARIIEAEQGRISVDGIYGAAVRAAAGDTAYASPGSQGEPDASATGELTAPPSPDPEEAPGGTEAAGAGAEAAA